MNFFFHGLKSELIYHLRFTSYMPSKWVTKIEVNRAEVNRSLWLRFKISR